MSWAILTMGAASLLGAGEAPAASAPAPVAAAAAKAPAGAKREDAAARKDDTHCAACHSTSSWTDVRFAHQARTGYGLAGAHAKLKCRDCHRERITSPLPTTCAGCHRDRHAGEFGAQCAGCHDETTWRPTFQADAHRRANFPLAGRHAAIPCESCHGQLRDRAFDRAAVACAACHRGNLDRTGATTVDHATFGNDCQRCHSSLAFVPANLPGHETCFPLAGTPHAGLRCAACHTGVPPAAVTAACSAGGPVCASCHAHACTKTNAQHTTVLGYQCRDRLCYECHRNGR
jgi:hypothetical protein